MNYMEWCCLFDEQCEHQYLSTFHFVWLKHLPLKEKHIDCATLNKYVVRSLFEESDHSDYSPTLNMLDPE